MGTGATRRDSTEALLPTRGSQSQLGLPLESNSQDEDALRAAWKRSGLPLPYHVALRIAPLAICIRCLADAMRKKAGTEGGSAPDELGSQHRKERQRAWTIRSKTRRQMQ